MECDLQQLMNLFSNQKKLTYNNRKAGQQPECGQRYPVSPSFVPVVTQQVRGGPYKIYVQVASMPDLQLQVRGILPDK